VRRHYDRAFQDPGRERLFISSLTFFSGFGASRAVTHWIRSHQRQSRSITLGGRHIHHLVFGIGGLLGVGYLWLTGVGIPRSGSFGSRSTAAAYGLASALTLDEFALWLNLQDVYWAKQGRESIDAAVLFGGLLSIGIWGGSFLNAVFRDLMGLGPPTP
jgi:hypothetical protein